MNVNTLRAAGSKSDGDAVSGKRRVVGRINQLFDAIQMRESPAISRSRRQCGGCRGLAAVANALVGTEDERLVSLNRTAGRSAELVLNQLWLRGLKEAACVQVVVAVETPTPLHESRSCPGGSPPGCSRLGSARCHGEIAGLNSELLDCVRRRSIRAGVARWIVEVRPVEPTVHVRRPPFTFMLDPPARLALLLSGARTFNTPSVAASENTLRPRSGVRRFAGQWTPTFGRIWCR